ncbi:MAG: hypothetical protein FWC98_02025 [Bacteroidales bacterium]|nr:hypothetical protein [Bacteroidales bacterium]
MKTAKKSTTTINVNDILDVLTQNNFSNEKQICLLQILNYALITKHYPHDICRILDQKIQILQHTLEDTNEKEKAATVGLKIKAVAILELLNKSKCGKAYNDLSKICKLIARITGNSYRKIYNELQKGICFSDFHNKEIEEVNKIFSELNLSISICKDKSY